MSNTGYSCQLSHILKNGDLNFLSQICHVMIVSRQTKSCVLREVRN